MTLQGKKNERDFIMM